MSDGFRIPLLNRWQDPHSCINPRIHSDRMVPRSTGLADLRGNFSGKVFIRQERSDAICPTVMYPAKDPHRRMIPKIRSGLQREPGWPL